MVGAGRAFDGVDLQRHRPPHGSGEIGISLWTGAIFPHYVDKH